MTVAVVAVVLLLALLGAIAWLLRREEPGQADRRRTAEERLQALERRNVRRRERDDQELGLGDEHDAEWP